MCGEIKPLEEFHRNKARKDGHGNRCKVCMKRINRKSYETNKELRKAYSKNWYANNKNRARLNHKKWCSENKGSVNRLSRQWRSNNPEKAREKTNKAYRKWRIEHPDKVKERCKRKHLKIKNDPKGKLNATISQRICRSLKGFKMGRHWEELVGYTIDQLKRHIEKRFTKDMSWENHGSFWHIDHKIPIAAFNFEKPEDLDFKRCWAINNLRPLEAKRNLKKHDKIERPFQPSLTL